MLSEIFSIPFLICLSISILLIGCSSIYFYQRISQQDHKIESMVSLISSMAEELKGGQPQVKPFVQASSQVCMPVSHTVPSTLIPVSDGEESDSEESDSDSSDDSENSSTYSDSEDENIEIIGSVEELKEIDELEEMEDLEEHTELNEDNIKSIHLEDSLGSLGSLDNLSLFKSIHISGAESDTQTDSITIEESTNYKKMPIQKLREIAQIQGHGDVSKLKKNELLKLLGAE